MQKRLAPWIYQVKFCLVVFLWNQRNIGCVTKFWLGAFYTSKCDWISIFVFIILLYIQCFPINYWYNGSFSIQTRRLGFSFLSPVSFEIIQCRFPLVGFSSLLLTEEEIWLLLSTSKTQKLRCKNTTKNLTTKIVADSLKHIYKQRLNKDNSKDI